MQKSRDRYLSPHSSTGLAGVTILTGDDGVARAYSHHASDPLADEHAHDAFSAWLVLEHGGDITAAVKEAAEGLGMGYSQSERPASKEKEKRTESDKGKNHEPAAGSGASLPEIVVNNRHMRDITAEDIAALQKANTPPRLFTRAAIFVRVDALARAEALTSSSLKGEMDRAANHVKEEWETDDEGKPERLTFPARPPTDVANDILTLPVLPFPELRAIAHVPQVLPGGAILSRNGYDPDTGILLHSQGLEQVNVNMPLAEARSLILNELLGGFPFADEGARAHAVAMLLQAFVMPLITGPTPLYLIDAPTRGTGKTLLYLVIAYIVLGANPAVMTLTRDGDELDKRITASLLEGDVMVVFDNVAAKLASDKLAAVLTARRYRGRRLGKSEMLTVNNDAVWVATGNNVEVSDEMARRIMPIRLDAGLERPEVGRIFQHPDLLAFVKSNRERLVSACLSLVNAWVKAGLVEASARVGSYESWAGIMGGILAHADIPGLLVGRERFASQADQDTNEWSALTEAWWGMFGERAVGASELFNEIVKPRNLLMDSWAGRKDLSALQRIGRALSSKRDRVFGGYAIRSAGKDAVNRTATYRLERVGKQTPETPETPPEREEVPWETLEREAEEAGGFSVKPRETPPKPPRNPRPEKRVTDGASIASPGVSGVSGVSNPPAAKGGDDAEYF